MARNTRGAVNTQRRPTTSRAVNAEEISRVAYELFERRGFVHGHDLEDWLEAERIVRTRARRSSAR